MARDPQKFAVGNRDASSSTSETTPIVCRGCPWRSRNAAYGEDSSDDAERAVETAAGVLTVDVRAGGHDGLLAVAAVEIAPDIADRVPLHAQTRFFHPGGHLILGGDPFRAVDEPGHAGFAVGAVLGQLLNGGLDPPGIDPASIGIRVERHVVSP